METTKCIKDRVRTWVNDPQMRAHALCCLGLGLLGVLMFGKYLVTAGQVLSDRSTDTFNQLIYTYQLGFEGLRHGDIVYWNPYNYGGQPFLGQFQAAVLYPPCWLVMWMPVATALNWLIFGHQWLLGLGVYGWGVSRGVSRPAAFFSAAVAMFCAPFMLHIFSGHIPHLCCMAWAPFVLWGIDGWLQKRKFPWLVLSAFAAAMQIYAGHPQYFYYTAIVAGVYALIFLWRSPDMWRAALGLIAIYPLALLFSAAQFIPGLSAATESVRAGGNRYAFASMFGLPGENLLTLIAPWFFGKMQDTAAVYWGRCYIWEMGLFFGAGGFVMSLFGLGGMERRRRVQSIIVLAVMLVLALGVRITPIYDLLYKLLPGYNMFRGTSKFGFYLVLLLVHFAGFGLDRIFNRENFGRFLKTVPLAIGGGSLVFGLLLAGPLSGKWAGFIKWLSSSPESYLMRGVYDNAERMSAAVSLTSMSMIVAGVCFLLIGALVLVSKKHAWVGWAVLVVGIAEVMFVGRQSIATFKMEDTKYPYLAEFLKKNQGDYRTLNMINPESAIDLKSEGVWGYDPFVLKRWAEFIAFTQGISPDEASQYVPIQRNSPLLALIRARYAFGVGQDGKPTVIPMQEPFQRMFVVDKYRVIPDRDAMFAEMAKPGFDPRKEVLLESDPLLVNQPGPAEYQIRMLPVSTDRWTVEVFSKNAGLLVMGDAYSKDWRVTPQENSVQVNYEVMPAYWALRAIPLAPGVHRFDIEYVPAGFSMGLKISIITSVLVGLFVFLPVFRAWLNNLIRIREPKEGRSVA